MDTITVYRKPTYVECNATLRRIYCAGIERADRPHITEILCLMRHTDSGEYLQAPVVVTATDHWSGFRPDRIAALVHQIA